MAGSIRQGKDSIVNWLKNESCTRILDIGAGHGTYYDLFVSECSLFCDAYWVGVEAWKPNIDEYKLSERYSLVLNEDARVLNWSNLKEFDITFMGDVLEHMTKEEAIVLVDNVMKSSRIGTISIPVKHWPQGAAGGNPFEVHVKDDWSHAEVMETFGSYIVEGINHGKIGTYILKRILKND